MFSVAMCFGIFISRIFIHELDMGLYFFFGGGVKEVKVLLILKR
jgi:hypothetical protein